MLATGISSAGMREVLGVAVGDSEDEAFWSRTFVTSGQQPSPGGVSGWDVLAAIDAVSGV